MPAMVAGWKQALAVRTASPGFSRQFVRRTCALGRVPVDTKEAATLRGRGWVTGPSALFFLGLFCWPGRFLKPLWAGMDLCRDIGCRVYICKS